MFSTPKARLLDMAKNPPISCHSVVPWSFCSPDTVCLFFSPRVPSQTGRRREEEVSEQHWLWGSHEQFPRLAATISCSYWWGNRWLRNIKRKGNSSHSGKRVIPSLAHSSILFWASLPSWLMLELEKSRWSQGGSAETLKMNSLLPSSGIQMFVT